MEDIRLIGLRGSIDSRAVLEKKVTSELMLKYKVSGKKIEAPLHIFSISDETTRKIYGQPTGLLYIGAALQEEEREVYVPDGWRVDTGKRLGAIALPSNELKPLPEEGIKMPDFWWLQLLNMQVYWEILDNYGRAVADRYIELGENGADNTTIIAKLKQEFKIR